MPTITYVEHNGTAHRVDVPIGMSIMEAAVNQMIPGIEGDCGGLCACGTCHVFIADEYANACGAPDELEQAMLEFAFEVQPSSRLSCQVKATEAMDGMVVHMPSRQY